VLPPLAQFWNAHDGEPRSYRVDRIASAVATKETFTPRYQVEF
jgi:hypothetical protein